MDSMSRSPSPREPGTNLNNNLDIQASFMFIKGGLEADVTPALNEDELEGKANYLKAKIELDETIKDLDVKLNRVLAKQEYEYLKGYNVYVKEKERELKATIN